MLAGVGFTRLVGAGPRGASWPPRSRRPPSWAWRAWSSRSKRRRSSGLLAAKAQAWQVPVDIASGLEAARRGGASLALRSRPPSAARLVGRVVRARAPGASSRSDPPVRRARPVAALGVASSARSSSRNWEATPLARRSDDRAGAAGPPARWCAPRFRDRRAASARLSGGPAPRSPRPHADGEEMARAIHETIETNVGARFGVNMVSGMEPAESARSRRFWDQVFPRMETSGAFASLARRRRDHGPGSRAACRDLADRRRDPGRLVAPSSDRRSPARLRDPAVVSRLCETRALEQARRARKRMRDLALVAIDESGSCVALRPTARSRPCRVERRSVPKASRPPRPTPRRRIRRSCSTKPPGDGRRPSTVRRLRSCVADGLFRAVAVRRRARTAIEFRYRTPGLRLGAIVSCVAWLAAAAILARAVGEAPGMTGEARASPPPPVADRIPPVPPERPRRDLDPRRRLAALVLVGVDPAVDQLHPPLFQPPRHQRGRATPRAPCAPARSRRAARRGGACPGRPGSRAAPPTGGGSACPPESRGERAFR